MRLITLLGFICAPLIAGAQTTTHRLPTLNNGFTRILKATGTGQMKRTRVPAIQLPSSWQTDHLLRELDQYLKVEASVQWQELSRQTSGERTRVSLAPIINGRPILDRDVVVLINEAGLVTSVNLSVPSIGAKKATLVSKEDAQRSLDTYLKTLNQNEDLHVSPTSQEGWLLVGDNLCPIIEFEITSPARLKHFTARIDLNSGNLIGLIERTIN